MKSFVSIAALSALGNAAAVFQNSTSSALSSGAVTSKSSVTFTGTFTSLQTTVVTVTDCPATVTDCPVKTTVVPVTITTTWCPPASDVPAPTNNGTVSFTATYTSYSTKIVTITDCPPAITDCPAHNGPAVITTVEPVTITTTWCPPNVEPTPGPAPGPAPKPVTSAYTTHSVETIVITTCPPESPVCPATTSPITTYNTVPKTIYSTIVAQPTHAPHASPKPAGPGGAPAEPKNGPKPSKASTGGNGNSTTAGPIPQGNGAARSSALTGFAALAAAFVYLL